MSEKRKKPTERQKNCSYSFPYMGENFDEAIVQYVMGRIDIARIAVTYRQHLLGVEGV